MIDLLVESHVLYVIVEVSDFLQRFLVGVSIKDRSVAATTDGVFRPRVGVNIRTSRCEAPDFFSSVSPANCWESDLQIVVCCLGTLP